MGRELPCLLKTSGQSGGSPAGLGEAQGIVLVTGKVGRGIPASYQLQTPCLPAPMAKMWRLNIRTYCEPLGATCEWS